MASAKQEERKEEVKEGWRDRNKRRKERKEVKKCKGQRNGERGVEKKKKVWLAFIHNLFKFTEAKHSEAEASRKTSPPGPTSQLFLYHVWVTFYMPVLLPFKEGSES